MDVRVDHPYYQEIKAVSQAGVIKGTRPGSFDPGGVLTRAQAITALIRALGFEGLAPFNPSPTPFRDDQEIPYWARDAIYVAAEMGLVSGDAFGRVLPGETMSRAEAAVFLQRFINYMQREMKSEYRDRLLHFR